MFCCLRRAAATHGREVSVTAAAAALAMIWILALGGYATAQGAPDQQIDFDIPAQALASGLTQFGLQSSLQVTASSELLRGHRTAGVEGRMDVRAGLKQLLAGTGLTYTYNSEGTVILVPRAAENGPNLLDPLLVQDDRGRGHQVSVTQEDLERRAPADMQDVFADEPSVSVGSSIPISQKLYVHGVEENNLAVSIDGARQNNKIFHHNATNVIDPSLLKAVRVDPGVAPADAGPGALGGAILFETVDVGDVLAPGEMTGGFARASFNTNGPTVGGSLAGFGRAEGFEMLGFVNTLQGDDYTDGNGDEAPGTGAALVSGLLKAGYEAETGDRFELSYERVKDDSDRPFRANFLGLNGNFQLRNYSLRRQNVVFRYSDTRPESDWLDPEAVLAYSVTDLEVLDPFGSIGRTSSLSAKLQNRFALSTGELTTGADFYFDRADYEDPTDSYSERAWNIGLFGQARLDPLDDLHLSLGVRGDVERFTGTESSQFDVAGLSGNVHGEYLVHPNVAVSAGYSHAFGGIALAENFIQNPNWSYARGINPSKADNAVAGVSTWYRGFTFDADVFATRLADVRHPNFGAGPDITEDFFSRGFEIALGYEWANGFAGITYARTDVSIDGELPDSDTAQYLGAPLGQLIVIDAEHRFDDLGLALGGLMQIALSDDRPVANGFLPYPGYRTVDVYASYTPDWMPDLNMRLDIRNLLDEAYADRATYGQEFGTVNLLLEPGRAVVFTARIEF